MNSTWTAPEGLTAAMLHERAHGSADVALVTLAPGAVDPMTSHAFTERIVVLRGLLRVAIGEPPIEPSPKDACRVLAEGDVIMIHAGVRHEVINSLARSTYLSIMTGHTDGEGSDR